MNDRLQALIILTDLFQNKISLAQSLSPSVQISPMTKELCFGMCRHYLRLEAIAKCLMTKKPKMVDLWLAILLGLYQLHYMNQPSYAVVKETVSLLEKRKKGWAKGLVNAVLREFCRKSDTILAKLSTDSHFCLGQPDWLLDKLKKDWPNNWEAIAEANDTHPPMIIRVNVQHKSVLEYQAILSESGIKAKRHPFASEGLILENPCDVRQLPGFNEGWVSVQDAAAQLACNLLDLKPSLRLLDACCAPGGKTAHVLEMHPNLAQCIALDKEPKRLRRVKDNLKRLALEVTLIEGDATTPKDWWNGVLFDRILLDAPCSATGVIRRHSDIKWLRSPKEITAIAHLQKNLLEALWPLLAEQGLMVYATCSVIAEENEEQIRNFVTKHTDCQALEINASWGRSTGHGRQILPGEEAMDGFFYAVLKKI